MKPFAEYLSAREQNRQHFSTAYPYATDAFETVTTAFGFLGDQLRNGRDHDGHTHISLAPFFFIAIRQVMAAFEALGSNQAYAAWASMRTVLESVLIMGKWVDDPENANIWERRIQDPKAYQKAFQGKALQSKALPHSAALQQALSHVNDQFLHPNPYYYFRHLSMHDLASGNISMELQFFDDEADIGVGLMGILHLVAVIQDDLAAMFSNLFVDTERVDVGLTDLCAKGADFRRSAGAQSPQAEWMLTQVGLWPAAT